MLGIIRACAGISVIRAPTCRIVKFMMLVAAVRRAALVSTRTVVVPGASKMIAMIIVSVVGVVTIVVVVVTHIVMVPGQRKY